MVGYSKFKDSKEIVHDLYFGMQAVEEFALRLAKYVSGNPFKISVDMVYSGIANFMTKNDVPPMSYTEVYEMMEEAHEADPEGFTKQMQAIEKEFWESKYGVKYLEKLSELKKKSGAGDSGPEQSVEDFYSDLRKHGIGYIGMSVSEYNNILYRDLMLKIEGHKIRQKERERHYRSIAFSAYIAPHLDRKKLNNISEEKFWPIDSLDKNAKPQKKISDEKRAAIRKALQEEAKNNIETHG